MNLHQHALVKLAEEAAEISQIALKTVQFGPDSEVPGEGITNLQKLHKELNDLHGVLAILNEEFGFDYTPSPDAIREKKHRIRHFLLHSIGVGCVRP